MNIDLAARTMNPTRKYRLMIDITVRATRAAKITIETVRASIGSVALATA